jgi:8-oxo-dGTP diphosphatase
MPEKHCYAHPHPAVATDIALFTVRDRRLQLLLVRRGAAPFRGAWALPGGFLGIDEELEPCARRELAEETGIGNVYLEQLYTFGQPDRDPRERVISIAYLGLTPFDRVSPRAGSDAADVRWYPFDTLPTLAFDHGRIAALAHRRLVAKLGYSTIALQFMPETFTLTELQGVYEALLNQSLDKRNFRKRILSLDLIEETGRQRRNGKHRPAREYRARHPRRVEIIK